MDARSARTLDPAEVRYGSDGLVAAVVQDADDGRVLMVAWQDAEAVAATIDTGEAHFHSRSRNTLWKKGETSGNTLAVVAMELDCDADAVLITARPAGPTCHTDARSCFDLEPGAEGISPAAKAAAVASVLVALVGCAGIAVRKGRSAWWCLLGLYPLIGVPVVWMWLADLNDEATT